jgi:hypothetical protein
MSAAGGGGGGPSLNAWKALLDFSTRHTEPEPNPDIKPMSKGARISPSSWLHYALQTTVLTALPLQRTPRS